MTREMLTLKMNLLGGMNEYISEIGEDSITEMWFNVFPDGADEYDLYEIAGDEELWLDCVNCFSKCCKMAEII